MAQTYTVKQVAEILGYSTNSIYTFLKEKRIEAVRVGKGRFRIPQTELDRLLAMGKAPTNPPAQTVSLPVPNNLPNVAGLPSSIEQKTKINLKYIPSLFDWFVGIASILLGISLFLFSTTVENVSFAPLLPWLLPLKISFITGGLGLILSDLSVKTHSGWHRLFHLILLISSSLYTVGLALVGDLTGLIIYGSLGLMLLFNLFVDIGGVNSFVFYIFIFLCLFPIGIIFSKTTALPQGLNFITENRLLYVALAISIILVCELILIWAYKHKNKPSYWIIIAIYGLLIITTSTWFAFQLYWGRAFILLLAGLLSILIPWWENFQFSHHRDRLIVLGAFSLILAIFIITLIIIQLMQANLLQFGRNVLLDDVNYGSLLVKSTLDDSSHALESLSTNPIVISTLSAPKKADEDIQNLTNLARSLFEASENFRRILVISPDGLIIAHYPYYKDLNGTNVAFQDYYQKTISDKKTYVSNVFQSVIGVPVVVISVPIFDSGNNLIGLLVGSLNLNHIGMQLQLTTTQNLKESFIVIDSEGKYIIHPDSRRVGTSSEKDQFIFAPARGGKSGIEENYNTEGNRALLAYDHTAKNNWTIIAQVPVRSIIAPSQATAIAIYLGVLFSGSVVTLLLVILHPRSHIDSS